MEDRQRYSPWAYLLAAVALIAAAIVYILNRRVDPSVQVLLAGAALFLAAGVVLDPERIRRFLSGRQARYGSNALLLSLAVLGSLGVLNYLAYQNPKSWDLTEDQQYTLAPETVDLLDGLNREVSIIGFYSPARASSRENIAPLLARYQEASDGLVSVSFVDPDENPFAAQNYGVTRDGTLVVAVDDRSEVLSASTEREITSAIIRLTNPGTRKVLFTTGHGEREIDSSEPDGMTQVRSALEAKNYTVETVNLLAENAIAEDALALIIAGPQFQLSPDEVVIIREYLDGGGALVLMYEPSVTATMGDEDDPLASYLSEAWGLKFDQNLIVDPNSNFPLLAVAFDYGSHPITNRLGNLVSYFPTSRSIVMLEPPVDGATLQELVQTSQVAFGETNLEAVQAEGQIGFDEAEDAAGPFSLAVAGSRGEARLVAIGDSSFGTNEFYFEYANGDLLINSIDWAAGQEALLDLTPSERTTRIVAPPSVQTIGLIFLVSVIFVPGAVIALGISMWMRRRRAR